MEIEKTDLMNFCGKSYKQVLILPVVYMAQRCNEDEEDVDVYSHRYSLPIDGQERYAVTGNCGLVAYVSS